MDGHDRSPVREKHDEHKHDRYGQTKTPEPGAPQPKGKRTLAKKAKTAKTARAKKAGKPAAERNNKKAEVIVLSKRARGAPLAEIMATTKDREKIESSKSAGGEWFAFYIHDNKIPSRTP